MPIYDQTYRRYEAREPLRRLRFWPITREALRLILARRAFLGLLAAACLPLLVRVVQVYLITLFPEAARFLPLTPRTFDDFLDTQLNFAELISVFGGAGLVADDLRTGAILVYLSRPLTRRDYVLGKLGVLLALNLSVTLLPGLLLYGIAVALVPGQMLKADLAWVGPAVVAYGFLLSLTVSLVALALSALSRSARAAGLGMAVFFLVPEIVRGLLRWITRRRETSLISIWTDLRAVGDALFGVALPTDLPWVWPALVVAAAAAASLLILRRRVRAVEIVR